MRSSRVAIVHAPTTADEDGDIPGDLDHLVVVLDGVRRVGLDQVGTQLGGLADQGHDLGGRAVDQVSPPAAALSRMTSGSIISGMPYRVASLRRAMIDRMLASRISG